MQLIKQKLVIMTLLVFIFCPTALLASDIYPPFDEYQHSYEWTNPQEYSGVYINGKYYFNLENDYNQFAVKKLWFYMEYNGGRQDYSLDLITITYGNETINMTSREWGTTTDQDYNWLSETWTIKPQPGSETIIITLFSNQYQWVHYAAMASTCTPIPIPGALWLFAPGLAGLAAIRRRFTK
jgi:hypothetical protein